MADNDVDDVIETPDQSPVLDSEQGAARSLLDTFKQEQQELADAKSVLIPVKGYERTGLQVQYVMPAHGKQLDDIARKVQREYKDTYSRNLYGAIDTMIALCDGLYVQLDGMENVVMLDPREEGLACQFDETLAELMGMNGQTGSARQVVLRLFGNNETAVLAHAERLSRWLANTKADLNAEIWQVGE
jgi:hypothetical protein